MVVVHIRVALAGNGQIKFSMGGKQGQHMIQKAHAGLDGAFSGAVQVQGQRNMGFRGFAADFSNSHGHSSNTARIADKHWSICASVPMVMRM